MKYKTVIFDVDGTLLNSAAGIIKAINYTINTHNLKKLSDEELKEFVGYSPLQGAFMHYCGIDDTLAQKCSETFREYYKSEAVYQSKVYEGIYELLDYLKSAGVKMGVATYKRQDYAVELMKHFGFDKYFDSICGADNENKLKKFDILVNCMEELAAKKEETLMVGDSLHDGGAALQLGVGFIGVTYGFGFKTLEEIKCYNPVLCADSPVKIQAFFCK